MRSILCHPAKVKGRRVHETVVSSVVEHIFYETAMHAEATAQAIIRQGQTEQVMVQEVGNKGKSEESKGKTECAKGSYIRKTRKLVHQEMKTRSQRQAQKLRNLHRRIPMTILTRTIPGVTMAGVTMNGMMAGVGLGSNL